MLRNLVRLTARWTVVALALFGAANVLFRQFGALDVNALWVRGVGFPGWLGEVAVVGLGLGLVLGRYGAWLARASGLLLALLCAVDAVAYYRLLAGGGFTSHFPVPAGAVVAAILVFWALVEAPPAKGKRPRLVSVLARTAVLGAATVALVLLHVLCFGATDYRRPADAAVVFGARVHEDGQASGVLLDRTVTACGLYAQGLVRRIVLSGGKGDDAPISEPACMKRIALDRGVPESALILDEAGVDTRATIRNLRALADEHDLSSFLMVSNDFHLSRIQLVSRRSGLEAYTVPARETGPWPAKPLAVLREGAAWLFYYLRGLDVLPPWERWPPPLGSLPSYGCPAIRSATVRTSEASRCSTTTSATASCSGSCPPRGPCGVR